MGRDKGKSKKKKHFKTAEAELYYHARKGHDTLVAAMLGLDVEDEAVSARAAAAQAAAIARGALPPREPDAGSKKDEDVPTEVSIQKPSHELELDWCNPKQHGMTALMAAAQHGKLRIVALLLHAGASSAVTDVQGSTSLIYACNRGRAAIVEALVAGGAPLEHRNSFGFTALAIATAYDKAPCVRALLSGKRR